MWYGVETVFVDGKLFDTYCGGVCYAGNEEESMNSCKRECKNRIEIHQDWFENENLAKDFCSGKITDRIQHLQLPCLLISRPDNRHRKPKHCKGNQWMSGSRKLL